MEHPPGTSNMSSPGYGCTFSEEDGEVLLIRAIRPRGDAY
jgi:hypothetical protein